MAITVGSWIKSLKQKREKARRKRSREHNKLQRRSTLEQLAARNPPGALLPIMSDPLFSSRLGPSLGELCLDAKQDLQSRQSAEHFEARSLDYLGGGGGVQFDLNTSLDVDMATAEASRGGGGAGGSPSYQSTEDALPERSGLGSFQLDSLLPLARANFRAEMMGGVLSVGASPSVSPGASDSSGSWPIRSASDGGGGAQASTSGRSSVERPGSRTPPSGPPRSTGQSAAEAIEPSFEFEITPVDEATDDDASNASQGHGPDNSQQGASDNEHGQSAAAHAMNTPVLHTIHALGGGEQLFLQGTIRSDAPVNSEIRVDFYAAPVAVTSGSSAEPEPFGSTTIIKRGAGVTVFQALIVADLTSEHTVFAKAHGQFEASSPYSELYQVNGRPGKGAEDKDDDGVHDALESLGPNQGDMNRDGLLDADQADVAAFPAANGRFVALSSPGHTLQNVRATKAPSARGPHRESPLGLISFDVADVTPGAAVTVEMTLPEGSDIDTAFKQNPATGELVPFDFDGTTGVEFHGDTAVIHLVDGGRGDFDGLANGVIVDPLLLDSSGNTVAYIDFTGWTDRESGGSATGKGTAAVEDGDLVLREGDSFEVSAERAVVIPNIATQLEFAYQFEHGGATSNDINDAFEVALLDDAGASLVPTIRVDRDSYFNLTEKNASEQFAEYGATTQHVADTPPEGVESAGTVTLDVSHLADGLTTRTLVVRLLNNDTDKDSVVRILRNPLVAFDDPYEVSEDGVLTVSAAANGVLVNDTGAEQAILKAVRERTIDGAPEHAKDPLYGTVTGFNPDDGTFTYTPGDDFYGTDTFGYWAYDGEAYSNEATVTITVNHDHTDLPEANDDAYGINTTEVSAVNGNVLGNDVDVDRPPDASTLTARLITDPAPDGLDMVYDGDGSFTYTPLAGTNGPVMFEYTATDLEGDEDTALVTITVTGPTPGNTPPTIDSVSISPTPKLEGSTVTLSGTASDIDPGDTLTAIIDWQDGSPPEEVAVTAGSFALDHIYADNATYAVLLGVRDNHDTYADPRWSVINAQVDNVAPALTAGLAFRAIDGKGNKKDMAAVVTGRFTDPGFTALNTTEDFQVTFDWGDSSSDTLEHEQLNVVQGGVDGTIAYLTSGEFSLSHKYPDIGPYTITVTVTDDDGGSHSVTLTTGYMDTIKVQGSINPFEQGRIPVEIDQKYADIDVSGIEPTSLRFGPAGARPIEIKKIPNDENPTKLHLTFNAQDTGFPPPADGKWEDRPAFLTGFMTDGTPYTGMDTVHFNLGNGASDTSVPAATEDLTETPKYFIADAKHERLYRYAPSGDLFDSIALAGNPRDVRGLGIYDYDDPHDLSDATLWAVDKKGQVFAQGIGGELIASWRADKLDNPQGITTNGADIWIVDADLGKVFRYAGAALLSDAVDVAKPTDSFALDVANGAPSGITTDGALLWVVDDTADKVFVYDVSGTPQGDWTLDAENADPSGITGSLLQELEGEDVSSTLWVVDRETDKVYKYPGSKTWHNSQPGNPPVQTFDLDTQNGQPEGIADPQGSNTDPVAQDDMHYFVESGTAIRVYALNNDYDVDGDSLSISSVGMPSYGSVQISANGEYLTYTPSGSFSDDNFTYTISDGFGGTDTGAVYLDDDDSNSEYGGYGAAAADDQVYLFHLTDGDPVDIYVQNNDYGYGGSGLNITSVGSASHGMLQISADGMYVTYTPSGSHVDDSFSYTIQDGFGNSDSATVYLDDDMYGGYGAYGDYGGSAPVANDDYVYDVSVGTPVNIYAMDNDSDPDGDTTTITAIGSATYGTVQIGGGGSYITYTPNAGFQDESFTYTIDDGNGNTDTATIFVDDDSYGGYGGSAPVAVDDYVYDVSVGTSANIYAMSNDSDPDGDTTTITSVGSPIYGTVQIAGGGSYITYTPNAGFQDESFTYTIDDGNGNTDTATIFVDDDPLGGYPPVAVDDYVYDVSVGIPVNIFARSNDSDPDGDTTTITSVGSAIYGTVQIAGGGSYITYTPNAGFQDESFTYTINDGNGNTDTATIFVDDDPLGGYPPVAVDDYVYDVSVGTPVDIYARSNDSDPDGDTTTITSVGSAIYGTVQIAGGGSYITYTPNAGFQDESFTYTINDGNGNTDTATIFVDDDPLGGYPPVAVDDYVYDVSVGIPVNIFSRSNDSDPDGDTTTITSVGSAIYGTVQIAGGGSYITYTPNAGFQDESFTYTINDGNGNTDTATIYVDDDPLGGYPPVAVDDYVYDVSVGTSANIYARSNDSDPDGDTTTITSVGSAIYGTVQIAGGGSYITYTPNAGFQDESFTYTIDDGNGNTDTATVFVDDDSYGGYGGSAPVANDDFVYDVTAGIPLNVYTIDNDYDYDGDPLTITSVSTPTHGTAQIRNGYVTYTPDVDFTDDSFTYTIDDGTGATATATVYLDDDSYGGYGGDSSDDGYDDYGSYGGVGLALTSDTVYDAIAGSANAIYVLDNDWHYQGESFSITDVSQPYGGAAQIASGGAYLLYTPDQGTLSDNFQYTVTDSLGATATASVFVENWQYEWEYVEESYVAWYSEHAADGAVSADSPAWDLASAMATDPSIVVGAQFDALPPIANSYAIGTEAIGALDSNDPSLMYAVLSTGEAALVNDPGTSAHFDLGGTPIRGDSDYDVTILAIDLDVPVGANYLSFDFQFLSEEYPLLFDDYNDAFIAELDSSTWTVAGGVISAPNNFAVFEDGSPVSVLGLDSSQVSSDYAVGTAFDASGSDSMGDGTPMYRAVTPITSGSHTLYLSIFDQSDSVEATAAMGDTAVLLDSLKVGTAPQAPQAGIAQRLTVTAFAPHGTLDAYTDVLLHGRVESADGTVANVANVTVNGVTVDAIDEMNRFFTVVTAAPGQNNFEVIATNLEGTVSAFDTVSFDAVLPVARTLEWELITDASASVVGQYEVTSFDDRPDILYADVAVTNNGMYALQAPLLVGVKDISRLDVELRDFDGITRDGMPYFDFTHLLDGDHVFDPGDTTELGQISFFNPAKQQFTYELVVLGRINDAPRFITSPVVKVEAKTGQSNEYSYDLDAYDENGDDLTYSISTGPLDSAGYPEMTLETDPDSGAVTLVWNPKTTADAGGTDIGAHWVSLRVTDSHGGSDEQHYLLTVTEDGRNTPPWFTSSPVQVAYVGQEYTYPATADDFQKDNLEFSIDTTTPQIADLQIDSATGVVRWTPGPEDVDQTFAVDLIVQESSTADFLRATQAYDILVLPTPGNHPPVIVSEPHTVQYLPLPPQPSPDDVDPTSITLSLDSGQSTIRPVSITLPAGAATADIVFVVDESGSMDTEHAWLGETIDDLDAALISRGITGNRYGLVGLRDATGPNPYYIDTTSSAYFGTAAQFALAAGDLQLTFAEEYSYDAMLYPFDNPLLYDFRAGASVQIVLVSDEDADDYSHTRYDELIAAFDRTLGDPDDDVIVSSIINGTFTDAIELPLGNTDEFERTRGTWTVEEEAFSGTASAQDYALSIHSYDFPTPLYSSSADIEAVLTIPGSQTTTDPQALVILDYQSETDFHYVSLSAVNDSMTIGHYDGTVWTTDGSHDLALDVRTDVAYRIQVSPDWSSNTIDVNIHDIPEADAFVYGFWQYSFSDGHLGNGRFGLGALDGEVDFDGMFLEVNGDGGAPSTPFIETYKHNFGSFSPGATSVLGVLPDRVGYIPDGLGGYTKVPQGLFEQEELLGNVPLEHMDQTKAHYVDLAWARAGSAWDLSWIQDAATDPDLVTSFSAAFADAMAQQAVEQVSVSLTANNPCVTSIAPDLAGEVGDFLVTFTGDDWAHDFELEFTQQGSEIGVIPVVVNVPWTYELEAIDPDRDTPLVFSWTEGSATHGAFLDGDFITWAPDAPGTYDFSLTVSDGRGGTDTQDFSVVVYAGATNTQPNIITTSLPDARSGVSLEYQIDATDADGDSLRYYLNVDPQTDPLGTELSIDRNTGVVSWTPPFAADNASYDVDFVVQVFDGRSPVVEQSLSIHVDGQSAATNSPPVIAAIPNATIVVGQEYTYQPITTDVDRNPLRFDIPNAPTGMIAHPTNGKLIWTPMSGDVGEHDIALRALDSFGAADIEHFTVTVLPKNAAPFILSESLTNVVIAGHTFEYPVVALDPNGDSLTYTLLIPGKTADTPVGNLLQWTTAAGDPGVYAAMVSVSDGEFTVTQDVTITVVAPPTWENPSPTLTASLPVPAYAGQPYRALATADDNDPDNEVSLEFRLDQGPEGMTIDAVSGELLWPNPINTGLPHEIVVSVHDGRGGWAAFDPPFLLPVDSNRAPEVTTLGLPGPASLGVKYETTIKAHDPDGDSVTYTLTDVLDSAGVASTDTITLGLSTGVFQWVAPSAVGVYSVVVEIADDRDPSASVQVTYPLEVVAAAANQQPVVVTTSLPRAGVGSEYSTRIIAADADNEPVTLYSPDLTAGMTLTGNGILSWQTPVEGSYTFNVYAEELRSELPLTSEAVALTLNVWTTPSENHPPVIGSFSYPSVVMKDTPFRVTIPATDGNGDVLTYSVDVYEENGAWDLMDPPPSGVSIDNEGTFIWNAPDTVGMYKFEVTVTDPFGLSDVVGEDQNNPLAFEVRDATLQAISWPAALTAVEGRPFEFRFPVAGAYPVDYSIVLEPQTGGDPALGSCAIDSTGLLTWDSPGSVQVYDLTVTATDGRDPNVEVENTITLDVISDSGVNVAPYIDTPETTWTIPANYTFHKQILAYDPNHDPLKYSVDSHSAAKGISIDDNGLLTWTPQTTDATPDPLPPHDVTVTVTDQESSDEKSYHLDVTLGVNAPPVIDSSAPEIVAAGQTYLYKMAAHDPDGDPIEYVLEDGPDNMYFDDDASEPGVLVWQTGPEHVGNTYDVVLKVYELTPNPNHYATESFTLEVVSVADNEAPKIEGTPSRVVLAGQIWGYDPTVVDADDTSFLWSLDDSPPGMVVHPQMGAIRWQPTFAQIDTHSVTLRVTDASGAHDLQSFEVEVRLSNERPTITSLPIAEAYVGETYTYPVQSEDAEGDPIAITAQRKHIVDEGQTSPYDPGTWDTGATTVPVGGDNVLRWTPADGDDLNNWWVMVSVSDGIAGNAQIYPLEVFATQPGQLPVITSTPVVVAVADSTTKYSYSVQAHDPDGTDITFPENPSSLPVNPDGSMSIDVDGVITWTPDVDQVGQGNPTGVYTRDGAVLAAWYPVRVEATSEGQVGFQEYTLLVRATSSDDPTIDASPSITDISDQTLAVGQSLAIDVHVTDMDLAIPQMEEHLTYELVDEPQGMEIDQLGRITWTPSEADRTTTTPGHDITVRVTDRFGLQHQTSFTVYVTDDDQAPMVDLQVMPGAWVERDEPMTFRVLAADNVGVESTSLVLQGMSFTETLPLNAAGFVVYTPTTLEPFVATAVAVDAEGNQATASETIRIIDPANTSAPDIGFATPAQAAAVTQPVDITGWVTDDVALASWSLTIEPADGGQAQPIEGETGSPTTPAVGDSSSPASLGTLDPTMLANGAYVLTLTAVDTGGNQVTDYREISIEGDLKLGNFNLSFVDLELPVGGFPLTVTRSYDTLDATTDGDFGYGWSMSLSNTQMTVSDLYRYPGALGGAYRAFQDSTRVVITLPDGTEEGFTFQAEPIPIISNAVRDFLPRFIADNPRSTLQVPSDHILRREGTSPFRYITDEFNYNPANFFTSYELTTANGIKYFVNTKTGDLMEVEDRAGNVLQFSDDKISGAYNNGSSIIETGRGITIIRDTSSDRITEILINDDTPDDSTDNQRIQYEYNDATGDLLSFYDRWAVNQGATAAATFDYNLPEAPHYLTDITDARGVEILQVEYDTDTGRISKITDASAQDLNFGHTTDLPNNRVLEKLGATDSQGRILTKSELIRDNLGNLVRKIEWLGDPSANETTFAYLITLYEYGDTNNPKLQTAEAFPLEITHGINPQSDLLTTSVDYNGADSDHRYQYPFTNDPENPVDPDANLTYRVQNTYDLDGNRLTTTDALGATSGFTYNSHGQVLRAVDPLGAVTVSHYKDNGLLEYTVDPTGRRTTFEYADRGNLSGLRDHAGTLLSSFEYNTFSEVTTASSASGPATRMVYDELGNQTATYHHWTNPDNPADKKTLVSRSLYDSAGRNIGAAQYEILDHVTITDADHLDITDSGDSNYLGVVTEISTTDVEYDLTGQVERTVDNFGRETLTTRNARGLVIETRTETADASDEWLVTRTYYNALGQAEFSTNQFLIQVVSGVDTVVTASVEGTQTVYDSLGRAVETHRLKDLDIQLDTTGATPETLPPTLPTTLATSTTHYDTTGRVSHSVDRFGTRTETTYDIAGRATETRAQVRNSAGDLSWRVNRTVYDIVGRAVYTTDSYTVPCIADPDPATPPFQTPDAQSPLVLGSHPLYDTSGRSIASQGLEDLIVTINYTTGESTLTSPGAVVWQTDSVYDPTSGRLTTSIGRHAPGSPGPATDHEYDTLGRQTATLGPAVLDDATDQTVRHRTETHYDDTTGRVDYTTSGLRVVVNGDGSLATPDGSARQETHYTYDAQGRTTKTTQIGYGAVNLSVSIQTRYDTLGRVIAESDPYDEAALDVTWDATAQTFADGPTVVPTKRNEYDDDGRLTAVILPEVDHPDTELPVHPRYEYTYDERGNMLTIRDNVVYVSPSVGQYDHDGAPGDDTRVTQFTYDDRGRQLTRTLPLGQVETTHYDNLGRTTYAVSFEGVATAYVYDDADGVLPGESGRLTATHYYAGPTSEADYEDDIDDNNALDDSDEQVTYEYDARGRQTRVTQSLATHTRITENVYDPRGRLVTVKNDIDGVIIDDLSSFEQQLNYEYDLITGQQKRAWTGDSTPVTDTTYTYDTLGRLDTVTAAARFGSTASPEVTDYVYDPLGNLAQTRLPNGVVTDYEYDALNRLDLMRHYSDDGNVANVWEPDDDTLLSEFDYTVRADGKRMAVDEKVFDGTATKETRVDWLYDNLGRLEAEAYDADTAANGDPLDFVAQYEFDLVGNRLKKETDQAATNQAIDDFLTYGVFSDDETIDYAYDANDRLTTETKTAAVGQFTEYTYDETQQIAKDVYTDSGKNTPISKTDYEYNLQGRMSKAEIDSDGNDKPETRLDYEYDASGIRVAQTKTIDGTVVPDGDFDDPEDTSDRTDYHVDHRNPTGYAQVLEEFVNGALSKSYTIGHDVMAEAIAVGAARHLLKDGHGSTRQLVDALGAVITTPTAQVYAYDAYGLPIGFDPANALTTLLYSGEQTDQLTGLQYLRARYYDMAAGRFNRLDPFSGRLQNPQSLHKYLYAHGDPINGLDPTGHETLIGMMIAMSVRGINQAKSWGASYAARQFAFATVETGLEALIIKLLNSFVFKNDPVPFGVGRTLGTNFAVNLATGRLGKAVFMKNALEITLRTISDVAFGENFYASLGTNLVSAALTESFSIAGQRLINRWFKSAGLWDLLDGVDISNLTTKQTGDLGESIAARLLGKNGFQEVIAVQNASGNGIDLIGRSLDGRIVFFEVKASRVGKVGTLSERQSDMMEFVSGILKDASKGQGRYTKISAEMQDAAARIRRHLIQDPLSVSGTAIGVDLLNRVLLVSPWS